MKQIREKLYNFWLEAKGLTLIYVGFYIVTCFATLDRCWNHPLSQIIFALVFGISLYIGFVVCFILGKYIDNKIQNNFIKYVVWIMVMLSPFIFSGISIKILAMFRPMRYILRCYNIDY